MDANKVEVTLRFNIQSPEELAELQVLFGGAPGQADGTAVSEKLAKYLIRQDWQVVKFEQTTG